MNQYLLLGVLGLGSAAAYALLSSGLVLIYRASGVLNFAQGAFAMVGAYLFYELRVKHGWSYLPSVVATVVVIGALGCLVYLLLMAPLREASVVVRVIATLGVMLVLQAAATLRYGGTIAFVPESLPHDAVHWGSVEFPQDRLWVLGIAVVVVAVLTVVSGRTRFGLVTRAVAENERSSAAYGRSPRLIAAVNWTLGAALAALAGVLIAPISSLSTTALTLLVVPALGVALFGGFSSFPLALLGAVIVGVVQGVLTKYQSNVPGLSNLIPLALIVIVLVVRRRALPGRGEMLQRLPSLGTSRLSPLSVLVMFVIGVLGALLLPLEWSTGLGVSVVSGVILLSIVVVTGYAGQLSLGQYALAGIGALTTAQLLVHQHWPFPLGLVCGVAVSCVVGFLFGLPSLRSRGAALAIVTLSLGTAVSAVVFNNSKYAGGQYGFRVTSLTFFGLDIAPIAHPRTYTIFCLCWFAVAVWVVGNLRRGSVGRRLISIRGNERAAAALGINVGAAKLYAFSVSAGLAGLGGILLAFSGTSVVLSQGYDALASANAVSLGIVGGVGYIRGAAVGGEITPGGLPGGVIANHIGGSEGTTWLSLIGGLLVLMTLLLNPNGVAAGLKLPNLRIRRRGAAPAAARPEVAPATNDRQRVDKKLTLTGLTVRFGGVKALTGVDLEVSSGTVVGLIGPNGAGKTTLIDAITGYVSATGEITAGGRRIDGFSPYLRARAGVTRGFQSLELFDDVTVEENLRAASDDHGGWAYLRSLLPSRVAPLAPAVALAVEQFQLTDDLTKLPRELSYGKRKLVAIARAVAASPDFLLLDEPAAGLGESESRELGRLIRELADSWNLGILLIEHDVSLIMAVSDAVAVLDFGEKIAEGTPEAVRTDPRVVAAYLGAEDAPAAAALPAPTSVVESPTAAPRAQDRPVVARTVDLQAGYQAGPVLHDLNLQVHAGEVVALLGPNGAGKTTTVLSLAGALRPMSGSIEIDGSRDVVPLSRRARNGMGYLAEERSVFMTMTVAENLAVAGVAASDAYDFFPELKALANRRTGLLSGGEQQMLALGAVLARKPTLLLADELSLGLAPIVVDRLLHAVRAAADQGTAVLLVEQHVSKALRYADHVYVLQRGRIVVQGSADELRDRAADLGAAYLSTEEPASH